MELNLLRDELFLALDNGLLNAVIYTPFSSGDRLKISVTTLPIKDDFDQRQARLFLLENYIQKTYKIKTLATNVNINHCGYPLNTGLYKMNIEMIFAIA